MKYAVLMTVGEKPRGVVVVEVPDGDQAAGLALAEKVASRVRRPEEAHRVIPILAEVDARGRGEPVARAVAVAPKREEERLG